MHQVFLLTIVKQVIGVLKPHKATGMRQIANPTSGIRVPPIYAHNLPSLLKAARVNA